MRFNTFKIKSKSKNKTKSKIEEKKKSKSTSKRLHQQLKLRTTLKPNNANGIYS